jgi:exopolysaccharide biosynthesis polyprenyl glycosylphosphotransferase
MTFPPAISELAPASLPPASLGDSLVPRPPRALFDATRSRESWIWARLFLDSLVLVAGVLLALFAGEGSPQHGAGLIAVIFCGLALLLLNVRRSAARRLSASMLDIVFDVVGQVSLAAMLTVGASAAVISSHPLILVLRLWAFSLVYLCVGRLVLRSTQRHIISLPGFGTPTLIVGAGLVGQQVARRLIAEPTYGLRPVGVIDADPLPSTARMETAPVPVLGNSRQLVEVAQGTGARQIIVAFSSDPDHMLVEGIERCRRLGISVLLVPRLFELMNERSTLDNVGSLPVIALRPTNPAGWEFAVKHLLDRLLAGTALLILSPVMLALALLVKMSSPGPILYRQLRVGRDGREFNLLKFRSMAEPPASAPQNSFEPQEGCAPGGVEGVDRRTRLGRFLRRSSLDELPQLVNVVRGEMSIVGPRPERPEYVRQFVSEVEFYDRRHRVRSGITGWAQVRGLRGQTSIAERVEWDNFYIRNWSLSLDAKILMMTLAELIRFRG